MIPKTTKPMHNLFHIPTLLSCLTFLISTSLCVANGENYVEEACSVTRYPDLCVKSLAFYSKRGKKNPHKWARAGVSVTIGEVKLVWQYLKSLRKHSDIKGRKKREALGDCVECIEDALENLYKSLGILRRLSVGEFDVQMSDVLTWLSAALTDEETCINGFQDVHRKEKKLVNKVVNATYFTSNALALVNKLSSTGLQDLSADP